MDPSPDPSFEATQVAGKKRKIDEIEGEAVPAGPSIAASTDGAAEEGYRQKLKRMLQHMPKEGLIDMLSEM